MPANKHIQPDQSAASPPEPSLVPPRPRARRQKGQPAGGRFRGGIGRAIFRTTNLFQNIVKCAEKKTHQCSSPVPTTPQTASPTSPASSRPHPLPRPDLVVNKVEFRLFNLVPGFVALTGRFESENGSRQAVKVRFEQPQLQLGALRFAIGPKSAVGLSTTYLDDRIRLVRLGSILVVPYS